MIRRRFSHQTPSKGLPIQETSRTPNNKVDQDRNTYFNKRLADICTDTRIKLRKAESQLKTEVNRMKFKVDEISWKRAPSHNRRWGKIRAVIKFLAIMKSLMHKKKLHGLNTQLKYLNSVETLESTKKNIFRWIGGEYQEKEHAIKKKKRFLFYNDSIFLKIWSNVVLILFMYTAIIVPFNVAFIMNPSLAMIIIDQIVNALFVMDIFVSILSVYTEGGQIVDDYYRIFIHYITGWFVIDFISVFPFDLIQGSRGFGQFARLARVFKLFKIFRILKISDRYKKNRKKHSLSSLLSINSQVEEFMTFFSVILLLTHITGCLWYFLSTFENENSWISQLDVPTESAFDQYTLSLYWAITTICTVGFGDIHAFTVTEKIFNLFWLCVGVAFYSYVIGTLSSMLNTQNATKAIINSRFSYLNEFAKEKNVNKGLIEEITYNLEYLEDSNHYSNENENSMDFLKDISLDLTHQIAKCVHSEVIERVILFYQKDINLLAQIIPFIFQRKFKAGEIIYKKNEYPSFIYFILGGKVGFFNNSSKLFKTYIEGSYFGEIELFKGGLRSNQVKALSDSRILMLPKENFISQIENFPDILEDMYMTSIKRDIINKKNGAYVDRLSFINFNSLITESQQADFVKHQKRCHQIILNLKAKIKELVINNNKDNKQSDFDDDLNENDDSKIVSMQFNNNKKSALMSKSKSMTFGDSMDAVKEKFMNLKVHLRDTNSRLKEIIHSLKNKNLRVIKKFELVDADIQCDLDTYEIDDLIRHLDTIKPETKPQNKVDFVSSKNSITDSNSGKNSRNDDIIIHVDSMNDTDKLKKKYFLEGENTEFMKPIKVNTPNLFNLKFFKKLNKNNKIHPQQPVKNHKTNNANSIEKKSEDVNIPSDEECHDSSRISDETL